VAYIEQIDPSQATGEVEGFYDLFADVPGGVPDIMKVMSLRPEAMRATRGLYRPVLFSESGLTRVEREMVAVVVSVTNACVYSVERHGAALLELVGDEDLIAGIRSDFHDAGIDRRTMAILQYAEKLTRYPWSGFEVEVATLRSHDLSDLEILDLTLVVAYFNYINRVATGLGVGG
jgi:uncharacterized peroxidase-related enzyme